ncbi:MAG: hypothetical protein ABW034_00535, partial [Steroidobacteraceae bacterium]
IGIPVGAWFCLLLAYPQPGLAETVCQGGGDKENAGGCSALVQKNGYYVIHASAEATADKSGQGELWMDVFINDAKKGHAETQCEDGGLCRVSVTLQMLLKAGKGYKVEAKQGNNRADTKNTRITVKAAVD